MPLSDQSVRRLAFAGLVVFLASPLVSLNLRPNQYEGGRSQDPLARAQRNTSAIGAILGEVRTTMADMLFLKTERYLHGGVAYRPHMEDELMSVTRTAEGLEEELSHSEEHEHEHNEEHGWDSDHQADMLMIPTAQNDPRGIIGNWHREVKPWRDPSLPHFHTDGTELLPWYRLMTLSDPYNIRAYALGSWWLKSKNPEQAVEFIEEGIGNNPRAFQLYTMKGQILLDQARSIEWGEAEGSAAESRELMSAASRALTRAAELVLEQRPPNGPENPGWTDYQEDDAQAALRLAALTKERAGELEEARKWARLYIQIFNVQGRTTPGIERLAGDDRRE